MKEKKLTVTGDVDPVGLVRKLRKTCHTVIVSVGPEKPDPPKKEEPKKEDPKKAEEKKKEEQLAELVKALKAQQNMYPPICYRSIEEDPNACVIC